MSNKIELLAPAKDLAKAKIAIMYGADAVYVGGKRFSLRSRASNFTTEDLKDLLAFAKAYHAKVYVTVNIVFHDEDIYGVREYLEELQDIGVDGIIVSSLGLMTLCRSIAPKLECHISTQLSSANSGAVETLASFGADRVVLAREASIYEIRDIKAKTKIPLEVFIHGGMCSNYSGRCVLSNRMTGRDANRGGCAHSCRWNYHLYDGGAMISDPGRLFSMSSKDLRASAYIEELVHLGIASLKIEGRMKSEYYVAQVVKTYRRMIDTVLENGHLTPEELDYYDQELMKAENREADDGFFSGSCDNTKHFYGVGSPSVTHDYVGFVRNYDPIRNLALIEVKNPFAAGEELELFGPVIDNYVFESPLLFDTDWKSIPRANKPSDFIYMRMPLPVRRGDMIRRAHRP